MVQTDVLFALVTRTLTFQVLGCEKTRLFGFVEEVRGSKYHYFEDGRKDGSESMTASRWYDLRKKLGYHVFRKEQEARVLHPYPLRAQYVGHRDLRIHDALQIKEIRHVVYG